MASVLLLLSKSILVLQSTFIPETALFIVRDPYLRNSVLKIYSFSMMAPCKRTLPTPPIKPPCHTSSLSIKILPTVILQEPYP